VSQAIATTTSLGESRLATSKAAKQAAPEEGPTSIPSSRASCLVI